MTTAEAFMEFMSCLDTAMALGLLDLAQLDELQARLAEGEEMIGRYAEANMRMTEGCSLEQELSAIKEQVQPAMARLKENDLVIQRDNEELARACQKCWLLRISRPGAPGRGDVRQHVTSFFWMQCGCTRACQHGLPCVEMMMRFG
ncbi:unnamed protein product [Prunus armeniaca]